MKTIKIEQNLREGFNNQKLLYCLKKDSFKFNQWGSDQLYA
jgi:hypothetical protein